MGDGVLLFPNINQVTEFMIIDYLTNIFIMFKLGAFEVQFNKPFNTLIRYTKENTFAVQITELDQDKKKKSNCIFKEEVRESIR